MNGSSDVDKLNMWCIHGIKDPHLYADDVINKFIQDGSAKYTVYIKIYTIYLFNEVLIHTIVQTRNIKRCKIARFMM